MKRSLGTQEIISVRIEATLMREIRILLLNPMYGKIRYGALRYLITGLLTKWLEDKKKNIHDMEGTKESEDRFEAFDKDGL